MMMGKEAQACLPAHSSAHTHPPPKKKLRISLVGRFVSLSSLPSKATTQSTVAQLCLKRKREERNKHVKDLQGQFVQFEKKYLKTIPFHYDSITEFQQPDFTQHSIRLTRTTCLHICRPPCSMPRLSYVLRRERQRGSGEKKSFFSLSLSVSPPGLSEFENATIFQKKKIGLWRKKKQPSSSSSSTKLMEGTTVVVFKGEEAPTDKFGLPHSFFFYRHQSKKWQNLFRDTSFSLSLSSIPHTYIIFHFALSYTRQKKKRWRKMRANF